MNNAPSISEALLGKLTAIDKEVTLLHFKWTYFMQLFGKQKHVAILNSTAPAIFRAIEDSMLSDILLTIMRLVDPPKSMSQTNLSLQSLVTDISDATLKDQIEQLETQARDITQDMKVWRNKKLAHNDLLQHLQQGSPLPAIQVTELTSALSLIRQAMNLIHSHFFDRTVLYEKCITEKDGNALVFYLNYGQECWAEDKEKGDLRRATKWRKEV
jgi:uncharacterized protein (UPF0147 family)